MKEVKNDRINPENNYSNNILKFSEIPFLRIDDFLAWYSTVAEIGKTLKEEYAHNYYMMMELEDFETCWLRFKTI